ncbi:hypothetical protein T492DRAFT_166808 [Pavlovales sp. CCMP2436]|nr:hypothetical protein T492DRAFT_166808 [Pavlovales sp. CCMP2436]
MSLVFSPLVSDQIVVVVVDMLARAKPPARLSSPDARSTPPRSLEQRTETAEANHLQFLLAKKGRAEELGSRRVDAALSKRSEKEVAAMRALAAKMASSDELLNTSRKIQMLKFEKARFLRQAARDARAKLDEAVADANAHAKIKVERASAKHSQLLAGVAHTNALKIARAKEISAKTKAMLSLEAAEQALFAKMAAATARVDATLEARLSPVKAHNERVRSVAGRQQAQRSAAAAELELSARKREAVAESKRSEAIASKVAKATSTVERAASQAKNAAEQAELSRARIVHAMFVRLQAAESKRAALLATPTKQSRARARTRDLESRHLGTAAQGLSFVDEPKRAISDALESRLLRPADADDVARALNLATAAERAAANCARVIGIKAALLQKLAAAHARIPAAQAPRRRRPARAGTAQRRARQRHQGCGQGALGVWPRRRCCLLRAHAGLPRHRARGPNRRPARGPQGSPRCARVLRGGQGARGGHGARRAPQGHHQALGRPRRPPPASRRGSCELSSPSKGLPLFQEQGVQHTPAVSKGYQAGPFARDPRGLCRRSGRTNQCGPPV